MGSSDADRPQDGHDPEDSLAGRTRFGGASGPGGRQLDLPGRVILDRYRVLESLGRGGMGEVFLAHDTRLDRSVVVKIPHPVLLLDDRFAQRFQHETKSLLDLEHPGIVRVLDAGEIDGVPCLVLEHLPGGSLTARLAKAPSGRQTIAEVLTWLRPLAMTLDYIHGKGVVHRDVKPSNVLFDKHGNLHLSDFGITKALETPDAGLTTTGEGMGSPHYMAPEQAMGLDVSGAADQYALGATVFRALGGRPPFDEGTPMQIVVRKGQEAPPSIATLAVELPPDVAPILATALARRPEDRYRSCTDFAEALARAGAVAEAPLAPGPTHELRARATMRSTTQRTRRAFRLLAVAAVVLAGVYVAARLVGSGSESGGGPDPEGAMTTVPPWAHVSLDQVAAARTNRVPVAFENDLGMRFVLIPAGRFWMGATEEETRKYSHPEAFVNERPRHEVVLTSAFYAQTTEVTNGQFQYWKRTHASGRDEAHSLGDARQPVVDVSWEDATGFAAWVTGQEPGRTYRLLTEAEWEYACRAGTQTRFSFGDDESELTSHANFSDRNYPHAAEFPHLSHTDMDDGHGVTAPVGSYAPNRWGLYDMHGNVFEWCSDWYGPYPDQVVTDPIGPATGTTRVFRSGSWGDKTWNLRAARRGEGPPPHYYVTIGFRLAAELSER